MDSSGTDNVIMTLKYFLQQYLAPKARPLKGAGPNFLS
jgi:hypothetical protein